MDEMEGCWESIGGSTRSLPWPAVVTVGRFVSIAPGVRVSGTTPWTACHCTHSSTIAG
jgi:hypothetical protein